MFTSADKGRIQVVKARINVKGRIKVVKGRIQGRIQVVKASIQVVKGSGVSHVI